MTRVQAWGLALLAAMALTACDKAVTGGNANAPGSPGTGNPREVTAPAAADTPSAGSAGASGMSGTSSGKADPASGSGIPPPGTGTAGGLGGSSGIGMTGSFPAGAASAASR